MAGVSKKQEVKRSTDSVQASKKLVVPAKRTNGGLAAATRKGKSFIFNVPVRLKSWPQVFKEWRQEDKKKRKYRSFRLQRRIRPVTKPIPSSWQLTKATALFLWRNKLLFGGIAAVHALLYIVLLYSSSNGVDIHELRSIVDQTFQRGGANDAVRTATLLGVVVGSPREGSNPTLATVMTLGVGLVYVWAARERINNVAIKVRDAYYQSLGPLMAVLCLLVIMSIQLIPFALATYFYTTARSNSLFASGAEDMAFFTFTALCGLLSLYFLTSSIIGLFIVTIPGMYPLRALAAAKKLVEFRRLTVFRRILSFPCFAVVLYLLLLLLVIRFAPDMTYWFMDIFNILLVPVATVYGYKLYRSLL